MAKDYIVKALKSCLRALVNLQKGNRRLAVGDLDHAREFIVAAIHTTIAEIEEKEGKF